MATCDDLPLGYKFEPKKEELVGYFLKTRLRGEPLKSFYKNFIMDFEVYSDHPANIMAKTKRKVEEDGFQQGYFFSSLTKTSKSGNGKRINRCIPTHGTWSEKAATTTVCYQNKVIGIHKYYKFNPVSKSKGSMLNQDKWMMHEYSVSDKHDMVLCHITNKKNYNNYNNKSTKARKINMVVDKPVDYEADPSKINRVDPCTASMDDVINAKNECADGDVYDESLINTVRGWVAACHGRNRSTRRSKRSCHRDSSPGDGTNTGCKRVNKSL